jgi:4-amino-4-deoxy-L-arabinose transferase-like glycosyltransferase
MSRVRESAVVAAVALALAIEFVGTAGWWPWDHDEVLGFAELGRVPVHEFIGPVAQLERMHRIVPVFAAMQNAALDVLPMNEWGARMMPATAGMLAVLAAFLAARRSRGATFGWALLLVTAGSQIVIWLAQQSRFYPVALLWLTLTLIAIWTRRSSPWLLAAAACGAALASLSHALTVVAIGSAAVASAIGEAAGWMPRQSARRAYAAGFVAALIYALYLRPELAGWISGNTAGTSPLVSYVAQIGLPTLALALVGAAVSVRDAHWRSMRWWAIVAAIDIAFVSVSQMLLGNWNPRYALFFMVPVFVLAAAGIAVVAGSLQRRELRAAWFCAVALMLAPKLASHFADGSRHDFRTAAAVVATAAPALDVYSNWPATMKYYLRERSPQAVYDWDSRHLDPARPIVVVLASNAWTPTLQVAGRRVEVIGTISKRRFDEQSHVIRIYRVLPAPDPERAAAEGR